MKTFALLAVLLLVTGSPVHAQATAEDEPELSYDIFIRDSSLTVWLDLSPVLDARVWDRLRDGVDVALECRIELSTPRWLLSDHKEAEQVRTIRLSYRKLTDDYSIDPGSDGPVRTFIDSENIEHYMADSVEVSVKPLTEIDPEKTLKITFRITSIFLTDLNLADKVSSDEGSGSPVRYLFRQFLELTDYGRRQYSIRSRPFILRELPRLP